MVTPATRGYTPNPGFGSGIFRRRIRLIAEHGQVRAALEDTSHAMRLIVRHDGGHVTDTQSRMTRIPLSTCPAADAPLRAFIGTPLVPYPVRANAQVNPRANCTHLHHLAMLAIAHARRGGTRQYDIEVPDEHPDPVWATLRRDGAEVLRWQTLGGQLVGPGDLAGRPLLVGFARWAAERFEGEALEAAFVMQNGYFVSISRRYDTDSWMGRPATSHQHMVGKCYSYQADVAPHGVYHGDSTRDTTAPDTALLDDFD